jgi:hypothetical protein
MATLNAKINKYNNVYIYRYDSLSAAFSEPYNVIWDFLYELTWQIGYAKMWTKSDIP